ncbi:uncharacterized protein LOC122261385 [Penaeus japonicus]|uniref:uncharacterized protein LOC122261385 n=1 Tax=Penaeus japonicus TaxID=27405 RepID=UPI001C713027|nr:uncharacterized protein LOC122261385 [Penaeus japonicus]
MSMATTHETSWKRSFSWHLPTYTHQYGEEVLYPESKKPRPSAAKHGCNQNEYSRSLENMFGYRKADSGTGENCSILECNNNNSVLNTYDASELSQSSTVINCRQDESPEAIMCDPCGKDITNEKHMRHLILGEVECTACGLHLKTCKDYNERSDDRCNALSNSKHTFQFCKPLDAFHEGKTANIIKTFGKVSPHEVWHKLSSHKSNLVSLENTDSLMMADDKDSQCQDDTGSDEIYIEHATVNQRSSHGLIDPTDDADRYMSAEEGDDSGDVLLLESYSLENLEEIIEYHVAKDELTHCMNLEDVKLNRSICLFESPEGLKREPKEQASYICTEDSKEGVKLEGKHELSLCLFELRDEKKIEPKQESEACYSFLQTPRDGYYYVGHQAIEECPMCYAVLCPSRFTVNIKTFVLTTVCSDCNLTIYLIDRPDSIS